MRYKMPAKPPAPSASQAEFLARLGAGLRAARKAQKVTAGATAEAAGVSRMTLHRIEHGESAVTIGAWLAVADALGLELALMDPKAKPLPVQLPDRIQIDDFPQLKRLAWQLHGVDELTPQQALSLYERNWRHIDTQSLSMREIALINALATIIGGGRPLV